MRRWCPPLLGLEPHSSPVRYLARRRERGAFAAGRALLRGSGIGSYVIGPDTPTAPPARRIVDRNADPGLTTPAELADAAGGRGYEAVCLRQLAGQVADISDTARAFLANTAEALHSAAGKTVAFVAADGFGSGGEAPELPEVLRAVGRLLRRPHAPPEPTVLHHLLWSALATGRPVQLHCGDPAPLAGFLHATRGLGAPVVLLPRPPHHRAAARLAAPFPHVYADAGPRPAETLTEAPFGKLLFSSGARALPELYVAAARMFVAELERLLTRWSDEGHCHRRDAVRIAAPVTGGTARRLYALPG